MATMVSCDGCERFVRSMDSECPFCGTARTARKIKLRRPNVARAALVALALAGCGDDDGGVVPLYGAPAPDSGPMADAGANDAATDAPAVVDAPPAFDATADATEMMDSGMAIPLYGAAPPDQ